MLECRLQAAVRRDGLFLYYIVVSFRWYVTHGWRRRAPIDSENKGCTWSRFPLFAPARCMHTSSSYLYRCLIEPSFPRDSSKNECTFLRKRTGFFSTCSGIQNTKKACCFEIRTNSALDYKKVLVCHFSFFRPLCPGRSV